MGLDFCKPCGNGFQAERDPGLTGGGDLCPCTTADCGTCGDRCCDVFFQVCVGVCCGPCSGDCSYTFCHLCLGVTQDLVKEISATSTPSDKEGKSDRMDCCGIVESCAAIAAGGGPQRVTQSIKTAAGGGTTSAYTTPEALLKDARGAAAVKVLGGEIRGAGPPTGGMTNLTAAGSSVAAWTGDCLISLECGPRPGGASAYAFTTRTDWPSCMRAKSEDCGARPNSCHPAAHQQNSTRATPGVGGCGTTHRTTRSPFGFMFIQRLDKDT
ncbi:unnamed protein product [Boreogadus saida]